MKIDLRVSEVVVVVQVLRAVDRSLKPDIEDGMCSNSIVSLRNTDATDLRAAIMTIENTEV